MCGCPIGESTWFRGGIGVDAQEDFRVMIIEDTYPLL